MNNKWWVGTALAMIVGLAQADEGTLDPKLRAAAEGAMQKGLAYLRTHQLEDGSYTESVGVTGLVLRSFLEGPGWSAATDGALVERGVGYLLKNRKQTGAITERDSDVSYNTSLALDALVDANDPKLKPMIAEGQKFLLKEQSDDDEGFGPSHPYYGGFGYEPNERPDMANEMIAMAALRKTATNPKDPVWQKALVFISRSQNRTESNDQKGWVGNDGGFIYTPGANTPPFKGTESYGAMTSAGLLSLLLCGADKQDPRVQAAFNWIRNNYTLDTNAGTGLKDGLYYYYYAYAQAMAAMGEPVIVDGSGRRHNWRNELVEKLLSLQSPDGSWINGESNRWMQDNRSLVTAFTLNALNYAAK